MAVMASASIVVTYRAEARGVTTFWTSKPSTAATPAAPTTTSTDAYVADWSTTMPAYDSSLRCYRVDRVERSDGTCSWGEVTEDQSWAGANSANGTATNASQTAKDAKQTAEQASKDVASWADKNKAIRRVFTSTPTPPYDLGDLWVNHPVEEVGRTHNELSAYTHDALSSFNEEELSGDGELTDIYVCTTARATGDYVMTDWVSATSLGEEFRMMRATYATNAKIEKLEDSIVSTVNGELTYTAPDGSTQTNELATKVKQTDTSLTATISRTDALETMVHEYSGGVLVSKIKNGATVNGALVNADGSFDVVNVTWNSGTPTVGKKLMRLANNSIEFNNPDTSYNICKITANGTITNIDVPNGSLAIDEMPAWCQALGDSGYDSFIAGKMLQLGAGNRTTYSEILIEPDGTTIDGYKFALGTNNTTDTWVPVIGGNRNAGYLVHRAINLKWGPNAYAVYGAYNPNNGGDHYYTTNVNEYNKLLKSGWTGSGVYFYAAL